MKRHPFALNLSFMAGRLGALALLVSTAAPAAWQPAQGPLMTRWAKDVKPAKVHPEYPRPQMEREAWLNLNGLWDYAIVAKDLTQPSKWDGQILVPVPGRVGPVRRDEAGRGEEPALVSPDLQGARLLERQAGAAALWGRGLGGDGPGQRQGGGLASGRLRRLQRRHHRRSQGVRRAGDRGRVWDPTDTGTQPRGKQVRRPGGILYTSTTGIWQTVWLEPVAPIAHPHRCEITPDVDESSVLVQASAVNTGGKPTFKVAVLDGKKVIQEGSLETMISTGSIPPQVAPSLKLTVPNAKLWSPDSPFLYGLTHHAPRRRQEGRRGRVLLRHAEDRPGQGREGHPAADAQQQAAVPVRPARPGLLAGRPLHRADGRGAAVRHRDDARSWA